MRNSLRILFVFVLICNFVNGKTVNNSRPAMAKSRPRSLFNSILPVHKDVPAVPDVLIVKWKDFGLTRAMSGQGIPPLSKIGAQKVQTLFHSSKSNASGLKYMTQVRLEQGVNVYDAAEKLSMSPDVVWAEPLYLPKISYIPNDPDRINQWYLDKVKAYDAFEEYKNTKGSLINPDVIIAIVDNGVDINHEDLSGNIWRNPGEIANNGIDDDGNEFVDDIYGWDFGNDDNDPTPNPAGNNSDKWHGTGVAGMASAVTDNNTGIAALGCNAKIMVVKTANDTSPNNPSYGYHGIVYAAEQGAHVINCSWGSGGGSNFGREIVAYADSLGAVVIGAAGNESSNTQLFPASFPFAISVAATNNLDNRASFSNWHTRVDIAAPGIQMYMPWNNGDYGYFKGTSFSAPLVSGVVAMVKGLNPHYTVNQAAQQVRITSNPLQSIPDSLKYHLGYGSVNAHRALTVTSPAIRLMDVVLVESSGSNQNGIYDPGETVEVTLTLTNYLKVSNQVAVTLIPEDNFVSVIQNSIIFSQIDSMETVRNTLQPLSFSISTSAMRGQTAQFLVQISDVTGYNDYGHFEVPVAPLHGVIQNDHVRLTLTSNGRLGYADYPENSQGEGFVYKNYGNLLFEGAFLAGVNNVRLSDVIRGADQDSQNSDFEVFTNGDLIISKPGANADEQGFSVFSDNEAANFLNIKVTQNSYSYYDLDNRDYIILSFIIENLNNAAIQNCYAGLFADWDVGDASLNRPGFLTSQALGYVYDPSANLYGGIQVLNQAHLVQYKSIYNANEIYDGYSDEEKWQHLSQGIQPIDISDPDDYSHVLGIGPFSINPMDTIRLGFAMMGGESMMHIQQNAENAVAKWKFLFPNDTTIIPPGGLTFRDTVYQNYPNPFFTETTIAYNITNSRYVSIKIYNLMGQEIYSLVNKQQMVGKDQVPWSGDTYSGIASSGIYFYQFQADTIRMTRKMTLLR